MINETGKLKVIHFTPSAESFRMLLDKRLEYLDSQGWHNIGFSLSPVDDDSEFQKPYIDFIRSKYLTRSFSLLMDIRYFFEVIKLIREVKPDAIFTYGPKASVFARLAGFVCRVPKRINVSWGMFFGHNSPAVQKWFVVSLDWLLSFTSHKVYSENRRDLIIMRKYPLQNKNKFKRLGQGVDVHDVYNPVNYENSVDQLKAEYNIATGKPIILAVARIVKEKGYIELLEACKKLSLEMDFQLLICGNFDKTRNDHVGIEIPKTEHFNYLGALHGSEIPKILACSDVFVLASHREGFPRSTVEAVAMGLPIVTTNARGCSESIDTNYNGLMVEVGQADEIFNALKCLLSNPTLRDYFSKNSRAFAIKNYDELDVCKRLVESLEN